MIGGMKEVGLLEILLSRLSGAAARGKRKSGPGKRLFRGLNDMLRCYSVTRIGGRGQTTSTLYIEL